MTKDDDKKEEKRKGVKEVLVCEKCNSSYVYSLADMTIVCRKCGHRTSPKD